METIKLDLIPGKKMPSLHASQYDDGRAYHIDLTENRVPYVLDGTETISLTVRKCDNTLVTMDIANTFADKSYIEFITTEQMTACAGFNYGEITLEKNGDKISSLNFSMEVENSPLEGGLPSDSEIRNLATQMRAIAEPMVEELVPQVIGDNYYTKTQTDEAIASATEDINNKIASEYDEEEIYYRGDIVLYNGVLYECDNTDASGEFNPSDWKEITLGEGIENVRDLLADYYTKSQSDYRFLGKTNPTGSGYFGLNRIGSAGANSVSVGWHNVANAQSSFAEGEGNTSSGYASHSEGYGNTASGLMAHAEGITTESSGYGSHSEGVGTIANHIGQHVFGAYNIADASTAQPTAKGNYVEIVGNGTDDNSRRNARTLDWQGNEMLAGDLTFNGNKSLTSEISRLDNRITDLPEPMVLKGTLGVGGTIETLPTASASNEGWTFKCITAGTYAGLTLKVGDTVTCFNPPNTSNYYWDKTGSQDTDTDTWRNIKVNGVEKLGNGISSGSVDFEDTANVKFEFDANGNKVRAKLDGIYTENEVDDLLDDKADADNTYTKEQVDDIVYNILPDDTASGSVANFTTSLELPIKSLGIDVNAVQSAGTPTPATPLPISGWDEISLHHLGENVFDAITWATLDRNQNFYSVSSDQEITVLANDGSGISQRLIDVIPNATYSYMSTFASEIRVFDSTGNTISNRTSDTFTAPANGKIAIKFYASTYPTTGKFILAYGSSIPTTWSAYNGTTEVINLGGTYYGGHFTQDKAGHRQFDDTISDLVNLSDLSFNPTTKGGHTCFYADLPNGVIKSGGEQAFSGKCSTYTVTSDSSLPNDLSCVFYCSELYGGYTRILIRDDSASAMTGVQFTAYVTGQITYEKANPQTIALPDGEPIITLNGTNNIFADTGDSAVEYKCSVNDYINAHQSSGAKSLGGVFLGGSNSGSEEEPTEDTEEPKEVTETLGDEPISKK